MQIKRGVAVLALTSGCSFDIKQLQRPYDPRTAPRCEANEGLPVGDLIIGGGLTLAGIAIAAIPSSEPDPESIAFNPPNHYVWKKERIVAGSGVVILGAAWMLVGLEGRKWNRECTQAIAQWDRRQIEQDEHLRGKPTLPATAANPSNDPAKTWSFWCAADGACYGDTGQCKTGCEARRDVWCAAGNGQHVCGISKDACTDLVARIPGRAYGICVVRHAKLDPPTEVK